MILNATSPGKKLYQVRSSLSGSFLFTYTKVNQGEDSKLDGILDEEGEEEEEEEDELI